MRHKLLKKCKKILIDKTVFALQMMLTKYASTHFLCMLQVLAVSEAANINVVHSGEDDIN